MQILDKEQKILDDIDNGVEPQIPDVGSVGGQVS